MKKSIFGLAAVLIATLAIADFAQAKGGHGGGHGGGRGHGGMHVGRSHGGGHFARHIGRGHIARVARIAVGRPLLRLNRRLAVANLGVVRNAFARGIVGPLRNPVVRTRVTAAAALAPWGASRVVNSGWWQHGNGAYGWVGPLYWPFAYHDIYDYALWGGPYGSSFWYYGYDDIYAGIFGPYGYNELMGYRVRYASAQRRGRAPQVDTTDQLTAMCNADSEIAGIPVDQIRELVQLDDTQRASLQALANASTSSAQSIRSSCPTEITLTAPGRLAVMQQRIEAMIAAVQTLQPPLQKFYDGLNDEQKARLNALIEQQRNEQQQQLQLQRRGRRQSTVSTAAAIQDCGAAQPGVMDWPDADIDRFVHPTDAQRAALMDLRKAADRASDMLKSCQPDNPLTAPSRLAAIGERLDVMLDAVKTVRTALDQFYGSLSDEQKAQFETLRRHT